MQQLTAEVQADLLGRLDRIDDLARSQKPTLPETLMGTLAYVREELAAERSNPEHLSLLGRTIIVWHLDQGQARVPLHAALGELGDRLIALGD